MQAAVPQLLRRRSLCMAAHELGLQCACSPQPSYARVGMIHVMALPLMHRRRRASAAGRDAAEQDAELVARLRAGDEQAFVELVARHHAAMLRLARTLVSSSAVAEEVVQDTWLSVLRGIEGFAGRSSLRTWLLRILVNRARSTGVRERRSVAVGDAGPAVDGSRFDSSGAWMAAPEHWVQDSEDRVLAQAMAASIHAALEELPVRQRQVVMLRDVDGLSTQEVCEVLDISAGNQRVLLHRGRSQLRQTLETDFGSA
jgi:RNA polymerase sigma-70 factor, ECF subfamily